MFITAATLVGMFLVALLAIGPWLLDVLPARPQAATPDVPQNVVAAWDRPCRATVPSESLVRAA